MRKTLTSWKKKLSSHASGLPAKLAPVFSHTLYFGGMAFITAGVYQVYRPAGLIAAGLFGMWIAFQIEAERR